MPWKIHKEHPEHFEVHGNAGPFRIAKAKLSPTNLERMRKLCGGGSVKKLAAGGYPNPDAAENPSAPPTMLDRPDSAIYRGGSEAMLHGLSSAVAGPASWAAGLHDVIGQGLNKLKPVEPVGDHQPDPSATADRVQRALTYEPRTPEGRQALEQARQNPVVRAMDRWNQRGAEKLSGAGVPSWVSGAILGTVGGMDVPGVHGEEALEPRPGRAPRPPPGFGPRITPEFPWGAMSEHEAAAFARGGVHLHEQNGQYIGGPPGVGSKELPALRAHFDQHARIGASIAKEIMGPKWEWYDDSAQAIGEATHSPAEAHTYANVSAAYSPRKAVDQALNNTNAHLVREALYGNTEAEAKTPGMRQQVQKSAKFLRGENPPMGPKEGVFAQSTDPTRAGEPNVETVNDTIVGQIWGWPAGHPFGPREHSWMNGEHWLALDRMKKEGTLSQAAKVKQVQSTGWIGKQFTDAVEQNAGRLEAMGPEGRAAAIQQMKHDSIKSYRQLLPERQANVTYETLPGVQAHLRDWDTVLRPDEQRELSQSHAWASPGEHDPIYAALKIPEAPGGTTEGLGEYRHEVDRPLLQAAMRDPESGEIYTSPPGGGHSFAAERMPDDVRERLYDEPKNTGFQGGDWAGYVKNPTGEFLTREDAAEFARSAWGQRAAHLGEEDRPALISEEMHHVPDVKTPVVERNPNFAAHPLVSTTGSGGPDVPSRELLRQGETFRGYVDAQKQGGYNMPRIGKGANGATMEFERPLSHEEMGEVYNLANKHGLNMLSGDYRKATLTGDYGGMKEADFGPRMQAFSRDLQGIVSTKMKQAGYHGELTPEIPWGDIKHQESGTATAHMLDTVSPRVGSQLDASPDVRGAIDSKIRASAAAPKKYGYKTWGPQASIQKARQMLMDHGVEGMRKMVTEAGNGDLVAGAAKLGLPAVLVGAYLGGGDEKPEGHAAGGIVKMDEGGKAMDQSQGYPNPDAAANPESPGWWDSFNTSAEQNVQADQARIRGEAGTPPSALVRPVTDVLTAGQPKDYAPQVAPAMQVPQAQAQAPMSPGAPGAGPGQMPQQPPPPASGLSSRADIMGAAEDTQESIRRKSDLEQWAGTQLAREQQRRADTERQAGEALRTMQATNRQRLDQMYGDLQGKQIDPQHFWSEKDGWGKLRAGIGMILSGIGSGLTGQPNMAAQFLQRGIDRDIEAQKFNLNKKWTQLGFFRDMMHDDLAAEHMVRAYSINAMASEIEAQATRSSSVVQAQQGRVLAAQARQTAMQYADEATARQVQVSLQRIQLQQAARNEYLIGHIYGTGGSPSQDIVREAGARGLIKPVTVDRQGTLAMARSDTDAGKLNDELPHWHTAQDIIEQMEGIRAKSKVAVANPLSDAHQLYKGLSNQLAGAIDHATNGRVNADTLHNYVQGMGGTLGQLWYTDPLAATREWVNSQHRSLVNAHTWHREAPSVTGRETAPTAAAPGVRGPAPMPGAIHITDGARGGWLVPGKPLPQGWRRD